MFIRLHNFLKYLALALIMVHTLSGTGLASLIMQVTHHYYAHVIFPCKGKGCACDKAGYELRGCQCDHSSPDKEPCCSEEVEEGSVPCCSEKKMEGGLSCCSEEEVYAGPAISQRGCGGEEEKDQDQLTKNYHFTTPTVQPIYYFTHLKFKNYTKVLSGTEPDPPEKIPIL